MQILKRYCFDTHYNEGIVQDDNGEWVKFADVEEALKPSHNKPQGEICCFCNEPIDKKTALVSTAGRYFCIDCYNKLPPVR